MKARLHIDAVALALVSAILLLGLIMVTSASVSIASRGGGDSFAFLERQLVLCCIGAVLGALVFCIRTEYLEKMAEQEVSVQDMAPAALINLVGSGEVPLSPTIFDANVTIAKQKGSPVEWRPLDPVVTTVGSAALMAKAANPHAALLFIDYLLSREGQQLMIKGGLWSPREDVGTIEQKFKKTYLDEKYSLEEMEAKFSQWEGLMRQLFMRKR